MPRMLDLIRTSSVPATLMQAAARGALSVPPEEMMEIMVHLANHNKVFGQQARMTLAGWDEKSSLAAAANPDTPQEVLDYLTALENLRPRLLPALIENPSVSQTTLTVMATTGSREVVEAMRRSPRVQNSPAILHAITSNANATSTETTQLHEQLVASGFEESMPESDAMGEGSASSTHAHGDSDAEIDEGVTTYIAEHAKEIAAEADKPFQPLGGIHEFEASSTHDAGTEVTTPVPEPVVVAAPGTAVAAAAPAKPAPKKPQTGQEQERGSALQKIARLDIK